MPSWMYFSMSSKVKKVMIGLASWHILNPKTLKDKAIYIFKRQISHFTSSNFNSISGHFNTKVKVNTVLQWAYPQRRIRPHRSWYLCSQGMGYTSGTVPGCHSWKSFQQLKSLWVLMISQQSSPRHVSSNQTLSTWTSRTRKYLNVSVVTSTSQKAWRNSIDKNLIQKPSFLEVLSSFWVTGWAPQYERDIGRCRRVHRL